jgi:hypothetical protein
MANFRLIAANGNGKRKFDFFGSKMIKVIGKGCFNKCAHLCAIYNLPCACSPLNSIPRVFEETFFMIFAKHETRENAPVFRETFASFGRSNFCNFCILRKF